MNVLTSQVARRPLLRSVATIATGAALSHAIAIAFAPLITRLYAPEAFGIQGVFVSLVGLISVVAALGYPTAIMLPKHDHEALGLARLAIVIGLATAILTALALHAFGNEVLRLLNAEAVADLVYLIPVAVFASVLSNVLAQWLFRKKAFALSARYGVLTALLINTAKSGVGLLQPTALALVLTNTVGGLLGCGLSYLGWRKHASQATPPVAAPIPAVSVTDLAVRHRDFPLLRTPQNLINALSQSLPLLLLAGYFGSAAAGQYAIAIAVLEVPARLIGGSVMAVFYPRITEAIRRGEDARTLIIDATKGMSLAGIVPMVIIIAAGPWLFQFVFGAEWRTAGTYAQLLAPWIFLQYINVPAVAAVPALRLQRGLLVYEIFSTGSKVVALWLGYAAFQDDVAALAMFCAAGVMAYLWLIWWVIRRSGSRPHTVPDGYPPHE